MSPPTREETTPQEDVATTPEESLRAAPALPVTQAEAGLTTPESEDVETVSGESIAAPAEETSLSDAAPSVVEGKRFSKVHDILSDPVTQHMGTVAPLLRVDQSVGEALDAVRSSQQAGRILYFYVVDAEQRLQGVVPTRKLLRSSLTTTVAEIMSTTIVAIPSTATVLEACRYFTEHKFLAFPVVDDERRIVGAVDVDLYTEELREIDRRQDSEDLFQLIGVHLTEAAQGNARLSFYGRFPWLLCNVLGGMLSAWIADAYQDVSTLAVVAPFIALVTALAESVSIQSVSLALQALHAHPPKWNLFARKVQLELLVGLLLGGACGLLVAVIVGVWKGSFAVAVSLLLGITGGVVASAAVGFALPFILKLSRRDPQLASGPMALALSDVVTLLCYFNLGRWLLG